jgi:hypothetical protein
VKVNLLFLVISLQFSVISFQPSVFSRQFAVSNWRLAFSALRLCAKTVYVFQGSQNSIRPGGLGSKDLATNNPRTASSFDCIHNIFRGGYYYFLSAIIQIIKCGFNFRAHTAGREMAFFKIFFYFFF